MGGCKLSHDEIRSKLLELIETIRQIVGNEREKGILIRDYFPFIHWRVDNFEYDDNGIRMSKTGTNFNKPVWLRANSQILTLVQKTDQYSYLLKFSEVQPFLSFFTQRVISFYLNREDYTKLEIDKWVDIFISDLENKPISAGADVQLSNVILHPEKIEICNGFTLIKPKKEDFEIDIQNDIFRQMSYVDPSAFMRVSLQIQTSKLPEIQFEVLKAVTILRLFKLGSVDFITYTMYSDSLSRPFGGTFGSSLPFFSSLKYSITDGDIDNLKKFWKNISLVLPQSLYKIPQGEPTYLTIAYKSFSDALLKTEPAEPRIAYAIMGLEALFFRSLEREELNYRLQMRIAKLLSLFSKNPKAIRRDIKNAYNIRSTYLHGSRLDKDNEQKLLKTYNGNLENLLITVLECLRKSLILFIVVGMPKEQLISLLEDSLISEEDSMVLKSKLDEVESKYPAL
jgi:hypothetical protein